MFRLTIPNLIEQLLTNLQQPHRQLAKLRQEIEYFYRIADKNCTSNYALKEYCNSLYHTYKRYYYQHHYLPKSLWQKMCSWVGMVDTEEYQFLLKLQQLKQTRNHFQTNYSQNWSHNALMIWFSSLFIQSNIKLSYKQYYSVKYDLTKKIKIISHRLMHAKNYSQYPLFEGLPRGLAAYKIKRELEKFVSQVALEPHHLSQMELVINSIEAFLCITDRIQHHQVLNPNKSESRCADIIWNCYQSLVQMPVGQTMVIPHGYDVDNHYGHSALVSFFKTATNEFSIQFINTGFACWDELGLPQLVDATKEMPNQKLLRYGLIEKITIEQISNERIMERVLDPILRQYSNKNKAQMAFVKPLYHLFQTGNMQQAIAPVFRQNYGICSHTSMWTFLSLHMDVELFKTFELFVTHKAIKKLNKLKLTAESELGEKVDLNLLQEDGYNLYKQLSSDLDILFKKNENLEMPNPNSSSQQFFSTKNLCLEKVHDHLKTDLTQNIA